MYSFRRALTVLLALGLCFTGPLAAGRPLTAATGSPTHDAVAPDPDVCTRPEPSCVDPALSASIGVAFHTWAYDSRADMTKAVDMMAGAGIRWIRIDMPWGEMFPSRDQVNAEFADDINYATTRATQDGMRVLAVLLDTPTWAERGSTGASPPRDAGDFGTYAGWVAANFGPNVDAYEIWNEREQQRILHR
ncbi:MAG: glycoside hydrolase family 5 protein [Actinomycetota bacterium]|nr:glycoside hydrolase family 5 protein [Actinomycetota bacterium]